ncbi:hypothetical protein [Phormidesmis sp. 146-33]
MSKAGFNNPLATSKKGSNGQLIQQEYWPDGWLKTALSVEVQSFAKSLRVVGHRN